MQKGSLLNDPYMINLQYCHGDSKGGHCGYCNSNGSKTVGFTCDLMKPEIYKSLMDSGWRRCGTYYYKPNIEESCCSWYTIRMKVKDYKIRKSHKKIWKKFENLVYGIEDDKKDIQKQEIQEKQNNEDKIKNEKQQKQQKTEENQEDQQNMENLKNIISQVLKDISKDFFLQNSKIQCDQSQNLELKQIQESFKVMKSNNQKKGDYFSNFWMLLFGKNKALLGKTKQQDFFENTNESIVNLISKKTKDYIPVLEPNGFITFINSNHDQSQKILTKKLQKSHSKEKLIQNKYEEVKVDESIKQQNEKEQIQDVKLKQEKDIITPTLIQKGKLKIKLEKATVNDKNLKMYQDYCVQIHQKKDQTKSGLKRFLCEQALEYGSIEKGSTKLELGCWHMNYYFDDKFVGVGVVDITPTCLSSVYFYYDPQFKDWNFGNVSSIIEILYVQELQKIFPQFEYYYSGYYIQTSTKMVYKGDFEPSQLLCPESYTWVELTQELRKLIDTDKQRKKDQKSSRLAPKETPINPRIIKDDKQLTDFVNNQTTMSIFGSKLPFKTVDQTYFNNQLLGTYKRICSGIFKDTYQQLHFGYKE